MISRLPSFTMEYRRYLDPLACLGKLHNLSFTLASCPAHVGGSLYGPMAFTEAQCRLMPHTRLNHEILKRVKYCVASGPLITTGHHIRVIYSPDIVDGKLDLGYGV